MHVESILRRLQPQPGFVYENVAWAGTRDRLALHVHLRPRRGSRGICSRCCRKRPGYDVQQTPRLFTFVPFWGIAVLFVYAMRRVNCRTCGVTVEMVPWAAGKTHSTHAFVWFVASWAKVLSWSEVARRLRSSWDTVFRCVEHAVRWGLANRNLDGIQSIGVDDARLEEGPQVSHARLPARSWPPTTAPHRAGPEGCELQQLLRHARRGALEGDHVRRERHVEGLPRRRPPTLLHRRARPRPLPRRPTPQQGRRYCRSKEPGFTLGRSGPRIVSKRNPERLLLAGGIGNNFVPMGNFRAPFSSVHKQRCHPIGRMTARASPAPQRWHVRCSRAPRFERKVLAMRHRKNGLPLRSSALVAAPGSHQRIRVS